MEMLVFAANVLGSNPRSVIVLLERFFLALIIPGSGAYLSLLSALLAPITSGSETSKTSTWPLSTSLSTVAVVPSRSNLLTTFTEGQSNISAVIVPTCMLSSSIPCLPQNTMSATSADSGSKDLIFQGKSSTLHCRKKPSVSAHCKPFKFSLWYQVSKTTYNCAQSPAFALPEGLLLWRTRRRG